MPTVKIELLKGYCKNNLIKIKNSVMDSVVKSLKLPDNDRNIRLMEYEPGMFELKPPYKVLIEISMFKGRSSSTKQYLFQSIVNSLENNKLYKKDEVLIFLNEQPLENWAGRGGIPADKMQLGFDVNV